ncbi:MAG: hypothetical protein ACLFUY_03855 [Desulfobacterales bacterium]
MKISVLSDTHDNIRRCHWQRGQCGILHPRNRDRSVTRLALD